MLSEIVHPGDKFELEMLNFEKKSKKTTYSSRIYDIIEEDKIKAVMPIEKDDFIVFPLNTKYELYIYAEKGLYKCRATLTESYRQGNRYVMILEVYTGLQKHQRREHYRLTCNVNLKYRILTEEEADIIYRYGTLDDFDDIEQNSGYIKGITLDISGGGLRFISGQSDLTDAYILAEFEVPVAGKSMTYSLLAKIIASKKVPNKIGAYEHRVMFEAISASEREQLIKFIFEEERRYRKNEKS